MRRFLNLILYLVLVESALAQTSTDSLWNVWQDESRPDTVRLEALNSLIWGKVLFRDPDSAIVLSEQERLFAKQHQSWFFEAMAFSNKGVAFDVSGQRDSALVNHQACLAIWKKNGDHPQLARTLNHLGMVYKSRGQYQLALSHFLEGLAIQDSLQNDKGRSALLNSIGLLYFEQAYREKNEQLRAESYSRSRDYLEQSLTIKEALGDKRGMFNTLNNIAIIEFEEEDYKAAGEIHRRCLGLAREMADSLSLSTVYNNLGVLHTRLFEVGESRDPITLDSAEFYLKHGLSIRRSQGYDLLVSGSLINLSALYRTRSEQTSDLTKHKEWLNEAVRAASEAWTLAQQSESVSESRNAAEELWLANKALGHFDEALFAHEHFVILRDSINSMDVRDDLTRQELAFRYEKESLQKQFEFDAEILQRQTKERNLKIAGAGMIAVLAMLLLLLRTRIRSARRLREQIRLTEEARERAERSEAAKQRFLAGMSHEIRTPLNAINGISRILRARNGDPALTEYIRAVDQSADRLLLIVNDILDQARIESGKVELQPRPVQLRSEWDLLRNFWDAASKEKNIAFEINCTDRVPDWLVLDPLRFNQIVQNLIGNAIKFTREGEVTVLADYKNGLLEVKVKDTGVGIAKEHQALIFESFRQVEDDSATGPAGTGLGLSIARQLAELMQGNIAVESTPGLGTTFTLSLPAKESVSVHPNSADKLEANKRKFHILVAEDDPYNYLVTEGLLHDYFPGAEIVHLKNGMEVVEALREDDYDLLLLDIQMPGLDGYSTAMRIREFEKELPIIAFSAGVLENEVNACFEAGMNAFIPKPVRAAEFVAVINRFIPLEVELSGNRNPDSEQAHFVRFMPEKLKSLLDAIDQKNSAGIMAALHLIRPQLIATAQTDLLELLPDAESLDPKDLLSHSQQIANRIEQLLELWK